MCLDCDNAITSNDGISGNSAYVYVAYADDDQGTGFSTSDATKCYKAIRTSNVELVPVVANFEGLWFNTCAEQCTPCADGATIYNGDGSPDCSTLANGDYYLDNTTGNFYYKSGGSCSIVMNIKGDPGDAGTNGTNGSAGAKGDAGNDGANGVGIASVQIDGSGHLLVTYDNDPGNPVDLGNVVGTNGTNGTNASMIVKEVDTSPSGSGITTVEIANPNLPNVLDIDDTTATLDFNIPFSNFDLSSTVGSKYFYSCEGIDDAIITGTDYLNAGDTIETTWYAYRVNSAQTSRRLKIKPYNDGAFTLTGMLQRKLKSAITSYNMQHADDTISLQGSDVTWTSFALFQHAITANIEPNINVCQYFPISICIHHTQEYPNYLDGGASSIVHMSTGLGLLCSDRLQLIGFENVTGLNSAKQYYMTININHTFANTKTGSPNYL